VENEFGSPLIEAGDRLVTIVLRAKFGQKALPNNSK